MISSDFIHTANNVVNMKFYNNLNNAKADREKTAQESNTVSELKQNIESLSQEELWISKRKQRGADEEEVQKQIENESYATNRFINRHFTYSQQTTMKKTFEYLKGFFFLILNLLNSGVIVLGPLQKKILDRINLIIKVKTVSFACIEKLKIYYEKYGSTTKYPVVDKKKKIIHSIEATEKDFKLANYYFDKKHTDKQLKDVPVLNCNQLMELKKKSKEFWKTTNEFKEFKDMDTDQLLTKFYNELEMESKGDQFDYSKAFEKYKSKVGTHPTYNSIVLEASKHSEVDLVAINNHNMSNCILQRQNNIGGRSVHISNLQLRNKLKRKLDEVENINTDSEKIEKLRKIQVEIQKRIKKIRRGGGGDGFTLWGCLASAVAVGCAYYMLPKIIEYYKGEMTIINKITSTITSEETRNKFMQIFDPMQIKLRSKAINTFIKEDCKNSLDFIENKVEKDLRTCLEKKDNEKKTSWTLTKEFLVKLMSKMNEAADLFNKCLHPAYQMVSDFSDYIKTSKQNEITEIAQTQLIEGLSPAALDEIAGKVGIDIEELQSVKNEVLVEQILGDEDALRSVLGNEAIPLVINAQEIENKMNSQLGNDDNDTKSFPLENLKDKFGEKANQIYNGFETVTNAIQTKVRADIDLLVTTCQTSTIECAKSVSISALKVTNTATKLNAKGVAQAAVMYGAKRYVRDVGIDLVVNKLDEAVIINTSVDDHDSWVKDKLKKAVRSTYPYVKDKVIEDLKSDKSKIIKSLKKDNIIAKLPNAGPINLDFKGIINTKVKQFKENKVDFMKNIDQVKKNIHGWNEESKKLGEVTLDQAKKYVKNTGSKYLGEKVYNAYKVPIQLLDSADKTVKILCSSVGKKSLSWEEAAKLLNHTKEMVNSAKNMDFLNNTQTVKDKLKAVLIPDINNNIINPTKDMLLKGTSPDFVNQLDKIQSKLNIVRKFYDEKNNSDNKFAVKITEYETKFAQDKLDAEEKTEAEKSKEESIIHQNQLDKQIVSNATPEEKAGKEETAKKSKIHRLLNDYLIIKIERISAANYIEEYTQKFETTFGDKNTKIIKELYSTYEMIFKVTNSPFATLVDNFFPQLKKKLCGMVLEFLTSIFGLSFLNLILQLKGIYSIIKLAYDIFYSDDIVDRLGMTGTLIGEFINLLNSKWDIATNYCGPSENKQKRRFSLPQKINKRKFKLTK